MFKSVFVKIEVTPRKFLVVWKIYRPPKANISTFNTKLAFILEETIHDEYSSAHDVQLCLDSNIDLFQTQEVTRCDRGSGIPRSLIDHITSTCLDDKLSWDGQHAHVYQKAAAGTFMLARLKRTVPRRIRLMIYNSLVRPYFEYCIEVWGCSKASDLKVFFKLQKMCVHHILGASYRSHTNPLFASNKI